MIRAILYFIIGIITSCYYFSFGFTFLPSSINTKMILAVVGIGLFVFTVLKQRSFTISKEMLSAVIFSAVFSLICFLTTDINNTNDLSYATYLLSFFTWLGGAYTVCALIRIVHGEASFRLLTTYLATVCFAQCVLALMIDSIPSFQLLVDNYVAQGQEFYEEVNRLYGIGAALDGAGVRFSIVLIMISALLCTDQKIRENRFFIALFLIAFFSIAVIGNIISRTTILGVIGGFCYFFFGAGLLRLEHRKFNGVFIVTLLIALGLCIYGYNINPAFHDHMRFAFEGFFNWVEKGEWRTDSTDKLNKNMWIWPSDMKSWIIGTGMFDNWAFGTDIGYCRFILYCGVTGFAVFALFFVYNAIVFAHRYPEYRAMFFIFLILTFLVWVKVSTDIFQIYAFFYCMERSDTLKFSTKRV
ncbi:hypothetical protein [Pedobacter antarcticus]|uniref:hypothetical protein n=1 Tax=Pedobacter antarcticus TaxID=34086 RepID=UPI00088C7729|nr:hypothetical protein [Pedobacter antarcticus]SDL39964.1 hypothetical protein SAMN04488084_101165 [Pedobacter antarcticus]